MQAPRGSLRDNSQQSESSVNNFESSVEQLSAAKGPLIRSNCEDLGSAVDKLLRLIAAAKKASIKSPDKKALAGPLSRLQRTFLSSTTNGDNVRVYFAPEVTGIIVKLSRRIADAVDASYPKSKFTYRRSLNLDGLETTISGLSTALDDFEKVDLAVSVDKQGKYTVVYVAMGESRPRRLSPEELVAQCPKFRILLMGKSGAGKSSLVNRVFNVDAANVSSFVPGVSDIRSEITSLNNPRFILHDSQGFESGENKNLAAVRDFLQRRKAMLVQEQVHAIWLCVQCPTSNERLLEKSDQEFLMQDFGIPVIIVFTMYDILKDAKECEFREAPGNETCQDAEIEALVHEMADEEYQRVCIKPLGTIGAANLQHARVSVYDRDSVARLVELTSQMALRRVGEAAANTRVVTQRMSEDRSNDFVTLCIGPKGPHWNALAY